ncbi:MAG: alpha-ketoglutarate decarboxylase [Bacteroidetes bacterium MedPE-SWsnd-G2]|nr:MAG: alpha-ketoglutarate decarboxylase [Bacteroidetes bacterium MedPE-SWsnd-G2]
MIKALKFSHFLSTICFYFIFANTSSLAQTMQTQNSDNFWSHVRFGGGIGMSFGDGFFSGTLAPSAIYDFNEKFALGVALSGTYTSDDDYYTAGIFGGSIISVFNPIREIQLSAEFEELNVSRNFDNRLNLENENYWYPALHLGVGYSTPNVTFGMRYDVLYDDYKSIYANPWAPFVRLYF